MFHHFHPRLSCTLAALAFVTALPAVATNAFRIVTLSSQPDKISGGDALVRVDVPEDVPLETITIKRNGQDITPAFRPQPSSHAFLGLVTGLRLGQTCSKPSIAVTVHPRSSP